MNKQYNGEYGNNNVPKIPHNTSLLIAILAVGLLIAGSIYFGLTKSSNNTIPEIAEKQEEAPSAKPTAPSINVGKVKTEGEAFVGNPDAPVTVAYWYDYQCPFCKRFEEDSISKLMDDYVKEGKVKIVFKDFQFLGDDSQTAGLIKRAVWDLAPSKFYEWQQAMFEKQDGENSGWGNKDDILALVDSLGIDSGKVESLVQKNSNKYLQEMNADKAEASSLGISGTPAAIIGGQLISGAQPYSKVKQLVESALEGK